MTDNKKEDLRVRRTKKLLSNALFSLIKKKPFEKVTVCDICDEAMVHRATFYSHFADKYALLTYSIDEHIPLELPKIAADDGQPLQSSKMVEEIIGYIDDNKEIYTSILKKKNDYSITDRIHDLFEDKLLRLICELEANGRKFPVNSEFLARFYAGACLNVVTKWLSGEMQLSRDELISNLNTLLGLSLY